MAFQTTIPVRFGDVDHAGIVYYPHFFIYFHEAFEDFFNQSGCPYIDIIDRQRIGFPTVHIETDFKKPLRYGDSLNIELTVSKLSRRSVTMCYLGYRHNDGLLCVQAKTTLACVNLDGFAACEIPPGLRELLSRLLK